MLVARRKTSFFISLRSSKTAISLISICKHYAIDIADPSSMQDACYMNFLIWLSGRASERGIQRSEVRFLMATQIFFLCHTLVTRRKISSFKIHICANKILYGIFVKYSAGVKKSVSPSYLLFPYASRFPRHSVPLGYYQGRRVSSSSGSVVILRIIFTVA